TDQRQSEALLAPFADEPEVAGASQLRGSAGVVSAVGLAVQRSLNAGKAAGESGAALLELQADTFRLTGAGVGAGHVVGMRHGGCEQEGGNKQDTSGNTAHRHSPLPLHSARPGLAVTSELPTACAYRVDAPFPATDGSAARFPGQYRTGLRETRKPA